MDRRLFPELALVALTATAAVGLGRLFAGSAFLGPVLAAVLVSHGLAWACRRAGFGALPAVACSFVGLLLTLAWTVFPHTTTLGWPTGRTWSTLTSDLEHAWSQFGVVKAPAPPLRGFVAASVVATWIVALVADSAAFRLRTAFEATVPSFTLLVFGSALGAEKGRLLAAATYFGTALAFLLLHAATRQSESAAWFSSRRRGGIVAVVKRGVAAGAVAVVAAVVVGPLLPGADADAILAWRDSDEGGGSRVTTSPLVDIRPRLVDQSKVEAFTVSTNVRSYWRLTALDEFDGQIWSSVHAYKPAGGRLPQGVPTRALQQSGVQDFTVTGLSGIWLPAAFRPVRFEGPDDVRYNADTASLLTEHASVEGMTYRVESAIPVPTGDELVGVPPVTGTGLGSYLDLPPQFPRRVRALAFEVVRRAGAVTPYAQARALQDHLRTFRYDLHVPPGHGVDALEHFLFASRRGYCEQFAGAYAAMARAVGLPARVAVGFTPGQIDANGTYHVRGEHAHAWPEVFLAGYGWVPFEPTPGRGIPNGESYTGVPEQQAGEDEPPPVTAPPVTTVTVPSPQQAGATTVPPTVPPQVAEDGSDRWWLPSGIALLIVAVVLPAAHGVGTVPAARRVRRRRRRTTATTPSARVEVAWAEALETMAAAGVPDLPSETPVEYARRAAPVAFAPSAAVAPTSSDAQEAPGALRTLAGHATAARFSPAGADQEAAREAEAAARTVERAIAAITPRTRRLRRAIDPRGLRRADADREQIRVG